MFDAEALLGEFDLGDTPSPCPGADLQAAIGTASVTNTGDMSATFDKTFAGSASAAPKAFGVYETKQVVREITPRTPVEEAFNLESMDSSKLTSLSSKTGMDISNDSELSSATDKVIIKIKGASQSAFSGKAGSSPFSSKSITGISGNSLSKFGLPGVSSIQNFTNDPSIRSMIPNTLSKGNYGSMQSIMGSSNLGQYSTCPNLANALNYAKRLLDPSSLLKSLAGLFGIVGMFDLKGVLNCVSKVQRQISMTEKTGLTNLLVSKGSFSGMSDYTKLGNDGSFVDKYDTVRRLSSNRKVMISPTTHRPSNTWSNPDVRNDTDELFNNMNINPSHMYAANTVSPSKNSSILDGLSSPVYSVNEINKSNPDTGFSKYILGSKDSLLRNIPSFLS